MRGWRGSEEVRRPRFPHGEFSRTYTFIVNANIFANTNIFQISVVADVVALPTFLSNALETAQGAKSGAAVPTY